MINIKALSWIQWRVWLVNMEEQNLAKSEKNLKATAPKLEDRLSMIRSVRNYTMHSIGSKEMACLDHGVSEIKGTNVLIL